MEGTKMGIEALDNLFNDMDDYVAVGSSVKVEDNRTPREKFVDSLNDQLKIADNPEAIYLGTEGGEKKYKKSWYDSDKGKMDIKVGIFTLVPSKVCRSKEEFVSKINGLISLSNDGHLDGRLDEIENNKKDATKKQVEGRAKKSYDKYKEMTDMSPKDRSKFNALLQQHPWLND